MPYEENHGTPPVLRVDHPTMTRSVARRQRGLLPVAAILILAVGAWLAFWPPAAIQRWRDPNSRPELSRLVRAQHGSRATVGRLTGGFAWAPPPAANRGDSRPSTAIAPDAVIAIAEMDKALERRRTATTLAAHAVGRLALGETDEPVSALEEALSQDGRMSTVWTDLSAAYLARAARPGRRADLVRALDAADHALRLADHQPEAWFNKALAFEQLHLRAQATAAWQRYLTLDPASRWAVEAREHLQPRESAAVPSRPDAQRLREQLFDETLPQWAEAHLAGRPTESARALASADAAVERIARISNDKYASDVVAGIQLARQRGDRGRLSTLAAGLSAYGAARAAYRRDDFETSLPAFVRGRSVLREMENPLWQLARIHEALIAYRRKDLSSASALFSEVRVAIGERQYACLNGRIDWTLGLMALVTGRPAQSAAAYETAIEELGRAGEYANQAFVLGLLATNYDLTGDAIRSWEARVDSLEGSGREGGLLRAAIEASRSGWSLAALEFAQASADAATAGKRSTTLADALRWQAVILHTLGDDGLARQRLEEARAIVNANTGVAWDRIRAEVDFAEALTAVSSPSAGLRAAASAWTYFESTSPPSAERLPEIALVQARLERRTGDSRAAMADLRKGIVTLTRVRPYVTAGTDQATFADVVRRLINEFVDLSSELGETDEAFELAERARAWDLTAAAQPGAPDIKQIGRELDPHTTAIDFVVADRRSYAWIITQSSARFIAIDAGRATLEQLVRATRPPRRDAAAAVRLRELLLTPATKELESATSLVIVPDGPLHLLSFATLPGRRARYLVEELAIRYSPSAMLLERQPDRTSGSEFSLLAIGNPSYDVRAFPELPTLPFAEQEAQMVAGAYPGAALLSGADATHTNVVNRLGSTDVVHFAGHAVANDLSPADSALILAGARTDRLTAREIRGLSMPRTTLVVLGACETATGFMTQSQGPLSLARAFLAAGADGVVASLWTVNDSASARLLTRFHRAYRTTGHAAEALREAQASLLHSGDPVLSDPSRWGPFVVVGRDIRR